MRNRKYINSTYTEQKGLLSVSTTGGSWIWTSEIDGPLFVVNDISSAGNIRTRGYIDIQNTNGNSKFGVGLITDNLLYIGKNSTNHALVVDLLNSRLGVGLSTNPAYTLDVGGEMSVSGAIHGVEDPILGTDAVNVNFLNSNFTTKVTNMHFAVEGLTGKALHKNYPISGNPNGYNWVHTNGNGELTQALNVSNNAQVCFTYGSAHSDSAKAQTSDYAMLYPQTPSGQGILGNLNIGSVQRWIHGDGSGGVQSMGVYPNYILGTDTLGGAGLYARGSAHNQVPYGDHTHDYFATVWAGTALIGKSVATEYHIPCPGLKEKNFIKAAIYFVWSASSGKYGASYSDTFILNGTSDTYEFQWISQVSHNSNTVTARITAYDDYVLFTNDGGHTWGTQVGEFKYCIAKKY